jgi:hypothetical protein
VTTAARLLTLLLAVGIVAVMPAAALASDGTMLLATEEPAEEEAPAEPQFEEGQEPAEIAPPASEEEAEQPWTTRFIAPGILLLGILVLIGAIVYYGLQIRGRYEVVD